MVMQTNSAAMIGLGTVKSAGASLASTTLNALLTTLSVPEATIAVINHVDIYVKTGPVHIENDGTAADANAMEFPSVSKWEVRNCNWMIRNQLTVFAAGAYDIRIAMFQ